jgi:hypothetical protein
MKKYKLGEKITILHKLKRQRTGRRFNWTVVMLPEPKQVTVVGVRVLWDGELDLNEEAWYFVGTRSKRAVLVAENLKSTYYTWA